MRLFDTDIGLQCLHICKNVCLILEISRTLNFAVLWFYTYVRTSKTNSSKTLSTVRTVDPQSLIYKSLMRDNVEHFLP